MYTSYSDVPRPAAVERHTIKRAKFRCTCSCTWPLISILTVSEPVCQSAMFFPLCDPNIRVVCLVVGNLLLARPHYPLRRPFSTYLVCSRQRVACFQVRTISSNERTFADPRRVHHPNKTPEKYVLTSSCYLRDIYVPFQVTPCTGVSRYLYQGCVSEICCCERTTMIVKHNKNMGARKVPVTGKGNWILIF